MKPLVRLRWIAIVALLPLVVLGALALGVRIHGLVRFDRAFFTDAYRTKYPSAGSAARMLEQALQSDDRELLAELQGLRSPAEFATEPTMIFVMLLERTERYFTYLYFDMDSYERQPHYFEEVDGRWVVSPQDVYYYMRSGEWQRVFLPLALIWWLVGFLAIALVWLFRASERMRARLYGD
ncbi:hypothetical protein ACFLWA_08665 [Chloroflexota bacterium]